MNASRHSPLLPAGHRQPGVGGFCRECFLFELEEAIAEEHPEMKRGDVFELVQEWLRLEDDRKH